jgi:hypothetical protein
MAVLEQDSSIFLIFPSTLWLFNIAMEAMADRNRWFTELKNGGSFHGYVSHNQMVVEKTWQST